MLFLSRISAICYSNGEIDRIKAVLNFLKRVVGSRYENKIKSNVAFFVCIIDVSCWVCV